MIADVLGHTLSRRDLRLQSLVKKELRSIRPDQADCSKGWRTISRTRSSRCCFSANLTAKPLSNLRMTRPTQAPTASGVPIGGSYSQDIATPAVETSMMKQA